MPHVSFSERVPVTPDVAWALASDLQRLGEWLPLHEAWRGEVPELAPGVQVTGVVRTKGLRNRVTWTVDELDPPERIVMSGKGVGGTTVAITMGVHPDGAQARFDLEVDFAHPTLRGPLAKVAERQIKGDLRKAVATFSALAARG